MGGFVKTTCEDYEYLMPCVSSIYTAGPGIDISSDNVISNTGVLSVNGQTGHVIIQAGDVTFSPYPNTFNTTGTTAEFLSSIASLNLPTGSAYLGQVSLSDMPEGVTVQGDVEVYVYPQNVIYAVMRSAEVEPYQWVADSYSNTHYGRGWMPVGNYVVESTTPSVAVEGMLWYDTTNNVVKVYDGTNWNEIGEGETYTAGTGIDITNNEISIDSTVAMASDVNTKTFYLYDMYDYTNAQAAYDWFKEGNEAIISINGYGLVYFLVEDNNTYAKAQGTTPSILYNNNGTSSVGISTLQLGHTDGTTIDSISGDWEQVFDIIETNVGYGTAFIPTNDYQPATKKYVDDSISAITIPTYTAGANITIDANNEISATDTTYTAGTYLTLNGTTFDVDTTLIATKSDLANFAGFEVVATLPQNPDTNIIYLKGPIGTGIDKYEEWIYSNSTWVQIGETSIDLTDYAQKSEVLTKTNIDSYTPTGNYNPTTKQYVDNGDTYIGSSAPSNPVEGRLWYDTTNDVLKAYDGTNWNSTGGSFSQVQADWNQSTTTAVDYIKNKPSLSTVATSGNYNDLSNKPTIPAAQVQANWNQTNSGAVDFIKNKPTIPAAQIQADWNQSTTTAVDYIKNKPTIPTVNNATLTIQKNGTTVNTFTANSNTNKTANITVPTKTSELSNDSGFVTSSSIPSVGNGTITINQGGVQKGTFTTNQTGNTTIDLDSGGGSYTTSGFVYGFDKVVAAGDYEYESFHPGSVGQGWSYMDIHMYGGAGSDQFEAHIYTNYNQYSCVIKSYNSYGTNIDYGYGYLNSNYTTVGSVSIVGGGYMSIDIRLSGNTIYIRTNNGASQAGIFKYAIGGIFD